MRDSVHHWPHLITAKEVFFYPKRVHTQTNRLYHSDGCQTPRPMMGEGAVVFVLRSTYMDQNVGLIVFKSTIAQLRLVHDGHNISWPLIIWWILCLEILTLLLERQDMSWPLDLSNSSNPHNPFPLPYDSTLAGFYVFIYGVFSNNISIYKCILFKRPP